MVIIKLYIWIPTICQAWITTHDIIFCLIFQTMLFSLPNWIFQQISVTMGKVSYVKVSPNISSSMLFWEGYGVYQDKLKKLGSYKMDI